MKRALAWFKQAQNEYKWGELSCNAGFYAQTCYISQQVAEKALKSIAYFRGATSIKSHSVKGIAEELEINGQLAEFAKKLDLYYISTRYPDALPDNAVPAESFSQGQAKEALEMAKVFLDKAGREVIE